MPTFAPTLPFSLSINSNRHSITCQRLEMIQSHRNQIKSSLITANCPICSRIASIMLHVIAINPNSSQIISNCSVRLRIASNSSFKPLNRRHNASQSPQYLSLVSRCTKRCYNVSKSVSKTLVTPLKGIPSN